ncbi:hypothetical protein NCCP2495_08490 [Dietzia sp. NCCP-2495]|uniref:DUF433 domain-containing protein n=1 Tax=Dietzia sp. NCCP-2495 TaxID=2934675 RepID=UPI0022314B0F|nr:DUF433 domain-containing protein [Dietzia sp. NCCP-2495]GLB62971.1 hypothetical protein NCCP2495_08490 [Dietzia sp. NCCP-2495]
MAFPLDLAATLSGASVAQLRRWNRDDLLVPEVNASRPMLYSFRDLAALRSVSYLRAETSLQRIKRAFANLPEFEFTDHPSRYKFATDGKAVMIRTDDGFMDLVKNPGQFEFVTLADIFESFENRSGRRVVPFERPRKNLRINSRRLGGYPVIVDSRVPYDAVAQLMAGGDVEPDEVAEYYPRVSAEAALDAVSFQQEVLEVGA